MRVQSIDSPVTIPQETKMKAVFQGARNAVILEPSDIIEPAGEEAKIIVGPEKLEKAVELANKTMEATSTELRFSIHKESGEVMVKVINTRDSSVVREIPPERVLDMVAYLKKMLGVMIDQFV